MDEMYIELELHCKFENLDLDDSKPFKIFKKEEVLVGLGKTFFTNFPRFQNSVLAVRIKLDILTRPKAVFASESQSRADESVQGGALQLV
jgi:hypothetical protein